MKQARANPFAVKSVFPESSETIPNITDDSSSPIPNSSKAIFDYDSERYEVRISFPNEATSPNLPTYSDTNITQSQILSHSSPLSMLTPPQPYSSQMQSQLCTATPQGISCRVVSICLNIAVSCNNLASNDTPQETICFTTEHNQDTI